uniref:Uncharacterized protein n=1 Tax=Aquila chrysaetos chrysaetos TaxID=223781 RepID=A0A663E173_AQUCH
MMLILANIMKRIYSHPCNERQQIHLIKDKDGIDDYLAKNIKGLSKQEAAAIKTFYQTEIRPASFLQNMLLFSFLA